MMTNTPSASLTSGPASDSIVHAASFELPLEDFEGSTRLAEKTALFPSDLWLKNASWFCRLRWGIIAILFAVGAIGALGASITLLNPIGFRADYNWAFLVAGSLFIVNLGYLKQLRTAQKGDLAGTAERNLRIQIAVDLACLTVVVHALGSLETYAPFLYLFHIVLAGLFFPKRQGIIVVLLALALYSGCVGLELSGILSSHGIYLNPTLRQSYSTLQIWTNFLSLLGIWLFIWHLASRLAAMVYARDQELAETNRKLIQTQAERTRHMLRTTHELKAPFAAINANTQLLINGYCGPLSDDALAVIRRISERGRRLSAEIQEMLQLANLNAITKDLLNWKPLDASDLLQKCIDQLSTQAQARGISIKAELTPIKVTAVEDHLAMLFTNLLSNAINYSHRGGSVRVRCVSVQNSALLTIEDEGIGIAPAKLPKIFDEHYRTEEAAAHNKESSGLGLAIVRQVAHTHKIEIKVESSIGKGTRFTAKIPRSQVQSSRIQVGALGRLKHAIEYVTGFSLR